MTTFHDTINDYMTKIINSRLKIAKKLKDYNYLNNFTDNCW